MSTTTVETATDAVAEVREHREAIETIRYALEAVQLEGPREDPDLFALLGQRASSAATVMWMMEYHRRPGAATAEGTDGPVPPGLTMLPLLAIAARYTAQGASDHPMEASFEIAPVGAGGWCLEAARLAIAEMDAWLEEEG